IGAVDQCSSFAQHLLQCPLHFAVLFRSEVTTGDTGLIGDDDDRYRGVVEGAYRIADTGDEPQLVGAREVVGVRDESAVAVDERGRTAVGYWDRVGPGALGTDARHYLALSAASGRAAPCGPSGRRAT